MQNPLLIIVGKFVVFISKFFNKGNGSTWPGHIALETNKNFIRETFENNQKLKVVLVAGTNGKTTTTKLLRHILEKNGLRVFQNDSGANLLNGVASTIIQHADLTGNLNYDVAIFEIDENTLPLILKEVTPDVILILNLFRDQLDRYGEVNTIANHWLTALKGLKNDSGLDQNDRNTKLFINGNDPELSYIGTQSGLQTHYFGIDEKLMEKKEASHDVDFLYCPKCQHKLNFSKMSYSHLGLFTCPNCGYKNPKIEAIENLPYSLFGTYNIYNTNAAALVAHEAFRIEVEPIKSALKDFKPAFGRQEVIEYKGRKIIILLSKNPAGFNQSLDAINNYSSSSAMPNQEAQNQSNFSLSSKSNLLLILNDRIPDGRDVSWIWDVDFENLTDANIFISGERVYDMELRIKYALETQNSNVKSQNYKSKVKIFEKVNEAIESAVDAIESNQTLFILPTYSAMLEVRKILKGRKIL